MSQYRERFIISLSWTEPVPAKFPASTTGRVMLGQVYTYPTFDEAVTAVRWFRHNATSWGGPDSADHDVSEIARQVYTPAGGSSYVRDDRPAQPIGALMPGRP